MNYSDPLNPQSFPDVTTNHLIPPLTIILNVGRVDQLQILVN